MLPTAKNPYFENKLIRDITKEFPQMSRIIERYFGEGCLKKEGFKILSLEMACILFSVNQNRLIQDLRKVQN